MFPLIQTTKLRVEKKYAFTGPDICFVCIIFRSVITISYPSITMEITFLDVPQLDHTTCNLN